MTAPRTTANPHRGVRPRGAQFAPEHLPEDAAACAEQIIRAYPAKRLGAIDSYVLSVFAVAWAWHKAATHAMVQDPERAGAVTLAHAGQLYPTPAVAMAVTASSSVAGRPGDGLMLVTPLQPAAAVCLAETDQAALRRILGCDEMRSSGRVGNTINMAGQGAPPRIYT